VFIHDVGYKLHVTMFCYSNLLGLISPARAAPQTSVV